MKKFFAVLIIAVATVCVANAQPRTAGYGGVRYHGEIHAGYGIGVGESSVDRISIQTVHGVMLGQYCSLGVGTGIDIYHDVEPEALYLVPLYLNIKTYIPASKFISPFISCDIGGGFVANETYGDTSGFMVYPSVGIMAKSFALQVGYHMQKLNDVTFGSVQFRVGFMW